MPYMRCRQAVAAIPREEGEMIRIKNWHRFQHFKDRRPVWIKLYHDLIDDLDWHKLDPLSAKTLVMLWIIASESEGVLPPIEDIAFRLHTTEKSIESIISKLSHWLEHGDIDPISGLYQPSTLDLREDLREEKILEREKRAFAPPTLEEVTDYCKSRNNSVDPIRFHAHYKTNGWKVGRGGLPMKDWKAAVVTWEK